MVVREVIYANEREAIISVTRGDRFYIGREDSDGLLYAGLWLCTDELDALCAWWAKKKAKEAK